jgi:hypothetical protein
MFRKLKMAISSIPLLFSLVVASEAAILLAQPAGTFTATGNMIVPRLAHTATLLANGKVLIAGGSTFCSVTVQCLDAGDAELYDPASGTFSAIGSMTLVRPEGAVLLPDGMVLFAEGYPTGTLASVELYDPATGNFNVVGHSTSLSVVNWATLLNDGRVLLVGGGAELYDPTANTFTPIANWPQGELGAPFEVLVDGRILFDSNTLFDPVTGTVTTAQPNYFSHFDTDPSGALLLSGKVLLTGGSTDFGNVSWAYLFDPATVTFSMTGSMSTVRESHTANLLPDGTVLIAGGASIFETNTLITLAVSSAELYDAAAGSFSATGSMTTPRFLHAAVVLNNGQVLLTGGATLSGPEGLNNSVTAISSAELYTPNVLVPAPALFSLSGDGQGAIWHSTTGQVASPSAPAVVGEALSMYTTSLAEGGVIPPQVTVGGRLAQVLYFGDAPGYPGYNQVNFAVPDGLAAGTTVPVRLTYLGRSSNTVTIAVQ